MAAALVESQGPELATGQDQGSAGELAPAQVVEWALEWAAELGLGPAGGWDREWSLAQDPPRIGWTLESALKKTES